MVPPALLDPDAAPRVQAVLHDLRRAARGSRGAVVVDSEGLPIASDLAPGLDVEQIGAVACLITQSADQVFGHLGLRSAQEILMEGREADIAVMDVGDDGGSLLVVLDKGAALGLVKLEMRQAVARIAELLGLRTAASVTIRELFVIHRSGLLLRHYSDTLRSDDERDILAGMMTAVQQFVRQALAAKAGELDEFRYGNYTVCFVRGEQTVAAVVTHGGDWETLRTPVAQALAAFEKRYAPVLANWDGRMDAFQGIDESFNALLGR